MPVHEGYVRTWEQPIFGETATRWRAHCPSCGWEGGVRGEDLAASKDLWQHQNDANEQEA